MAGPGLKRQDLYQDSAATAFSVGYKNDAYIAGNILPVVRVSEPTGKYYKF